MLLVAPKPLLGQWQQELFTLFGIEARERACERRARFRGRGRVPRSDARLLGSERGATRLLAAGPFDLCVIDEAHEVFAGIYKRFDEHGALRRGLAAREDRRRACATLLGGQHAGAAAHGHADPELARELWGLVQYVDPHGTLLGDLPTFRECSAPTTTA